MRRIFVSFLILVMLVFASVFGYKYWLLNQDWREEYAYAKGVDAFIHTFPYFLNSALRYKWSHSSEKINRGPSEAINQFWHAPNVSHPRTYQDGGMPTRDALYSVAWVWVGDEPTVQRLVPGVGEDHMSCLRHVAESLGMPPITLSGSRKLFQNNGVV